MQNSAVVTKQAAETIMDAQSQVIGRLSKVLQRLSELRRTVGVNMPEPSEPCLPPTSICETLRDFTAQTHVLLGDIETELSRVETTVGFRGVLGKGQAGNVYGVGLQSR